MSLSKTLNTIIRAGQSMICTALCLWLSACITLSSRHIDVPKHTSPISDAASLRQEVNELAAPLVDNGITPGLLVGVYTSGTGMRFYGYGIYDKRIDAPPDAQTVFPIGSLTKLYTGSLVSLFVQRGLLNWDDRLDELLPEGTALSEDAASITLEQLATHTSGLPRQPMTVQTFSYFVRYLFTGESFYDHFDQDYLYSFLSHFEALGPPGYTYSNFGFALLGHILELRSGQSLEDLLEENLFTPLALHNTALSLSALPDELHRARGYAGDQPGFIKRGDPVPDWDFTPIMRATGAMHATGQDILTFAKAHFAAPSAELKNAFADSLRVRLEREDHSFQAIDWEQDRIGEQKIHYAIGFVAGYSSYLGLDMDNQHAVVVLQNSFNWDDKVGHRLLIRLHGAQPPSGTMAGLSPGAH
mgnify:CR=1 FL=1